MSVNEMREHLFKLWRKAQHEPDKKRKAELLVAFERAKEKYQTAKLLRVN